MNINVPENLDADKIMRRSGYGFLRDRKYGTESYVRRLGGGFYPRFHVYLEGGMIKLHLDQKQVSYEGSSAHSGEYDGPTVEVEIARIQQTIARMQSDESADESSAKPDLSAQTGEKKGLFGKFFG
jgi:hypothetical protein